MSASVRPTSYDLMCRVLRDVLRDAVQAGPGAVGGIGSIECQAVVTLYLLLMDHPIDSRGRCRSCRRSGAVFGPRWRRCRVHAKAALWLRQSHEVLLLRLLAHELGLAVAPPPPPPPPPPPAAPGRVPASDPEDTLDIRLPLTPVEPADHDVRAPDMVGPGRATTPGPVLPPPVHHNLGVAW